MLRNAICSFRRSHNGYHHQKGSSMSTGTLIAIIVGLSLNAILAFIAGGIASKKGYSYEGFILLDLFLPILGLVIAIVIPDKTVPTSSAADEIMKYKQLLDDGAITEEEFYIKKKELLS